MDASLSIPEVKPVKRRWPGLCFAASILSLVLLGAWLVAGFFYASSVLKEYGVELKADRIEMFFSDGSSVDLSRPEFFEEESESPFTELQYKEAVSQFDRFDTEYIEARAWMMPLIVSGVVALIGFLLSLPLYILVLILIYKGWKCLRMLKSLACDETSLMPGPALAVVLWFVPVFNLLWAYVCLPGFAFYGKKLAALKGISYRGPSLALGVCMAMWLSLEAAFDIVTHFEWLPVPLWGYALWLLLISFVPVVLLFLFARRLNLMVEDFGGSCSREHAGLPE